MKPKAQPCPRQDSRQAKDAGAARSRKEIWPTSASAHDGCTGSCPDAGKANTNDKDENAPAAAGGLVREARRGSSIGKAGRRVGEPSFVSYRRRTASVEDGTFSHNLSQQAGA
ncbi:hypothetical protein KTE13_08925 [Burkholderia multivorans]|uniref:hypothetical protein n=1 Tax=Burkholderia multivorans TaxID=87883 RepID=UPI0012FE63CC|nr:hypothetical protein [Burkholderia multivorans]MBU9399856.1 hypothetical protein [Burkholderia multivorans]MBU9589920.1 hypothetical protein [Burkholderia multivorans]